MNRFEKIIIASVIGIIVNIVLGVMKIVVGLSVNSIAIISDAINNFSDSVSSLVSLVTIKISSMGATKKHPFGFGRIEYISGAVISVIVILTGVEFLKSSFSRVINPVDTQFNLVSMLVLVTVKMPQP